MERIRMTTADPADAAARVRALIPAGGSVAGAVAEIVAAVREGGDAALLEHERRFGGGTLPLRVAPDELQAALEQLDPAVRSGLETARANVGRVAAAGIGEDVDVALPEGQRVRLREVPVRRAAVYAPGGRAPYPSSVVMGAVTARAAGVGSVVVATPGPPVILAACAICCVDEVYRMGGAQAIAALAYGTGSVAPVDVIVGPGNLFVQEAKRQVSDHVGIDGFAGPSELVVIATAGADATPVALDLLAQAEHGDDSLVVAVSDDDDLLAAIEQELAVGRPTVADGPKVLVAADGPEAALAFAEALAPEHLQLIGEAAEALAPRVTRAGCLFVGAESATAFGDYVAGSNHTLPTGGAARFASGLSARHFRRRMSEVRVGAAADALAAAGVPIAEAEGFAVHAESMRARIRDNPPR
jgi:histidinol dehydrogenase